MSPSERALALRGPEVVHDTIDNETVVIDLLSGTYYSLRGSAPVIWLLAVGGASAAGIVGLLSSRFSADDRFVATEVEALIAELIASGLLVETTAAPGAVGELSVDTYTTPVFETYSDLQSLLVLDPVHDVDGSGWPNVAAS